MTKIAQEKIEQIRREVLKLEPRLRFTYGRRLVETHAPELMSWFNQLCGHLSTPKPMSVLPSITIAQTVRFDPELARLAYKLNLFPMFRVWVYATHFIGNGCGWVKKEDILSTLNRFGFRLSSRHLNRLIQRGNDVFWTLDRSTARLYLTGYVNLCKQLVAQSIAVGDITLETNRPGKRRVVADLTGTLENAVANAYAGWYRSKDKGHGVTISRDLLCELWGVAIATLLSWEEIAGITKSPNYAQSHDTSIDKIPAHAYLCKASNGSEFVSWQMPNTYYSPKQIQSHAHIGNTREAREAVNVQVNEASQPATQKGQPEDSGLNGGLLRFGKLYFDNEQSCSRHLRNHQDVFVPHYFLLGVQGRIRIYERYDILSNAQQTGLDRDFAQEHDLRFAVKRMNLIYELAKGQKL